MAKAFAKGQEVTYIADWDHKGTVYFRHAVVYSCGMKQMVLTDAETGVEMGRHFSPQVGEIVGTFPRMSDDEARAACLRAAEVLLAKERAHFAQRLSVWGDDPGYAAAIQRNLDALHEPRATSYAEAYAAIRAKVHGHAA